MRSGGKDFSLIEANVMFILERVFNNCIFSNLIITGIRDTLFEMGVGVISTDPSSDFPVHQQSPI